MEIQEYLSARVDDQIAWFSNKSQSNQQTFKRLRVAEVVFAATIPFLAGHISNGDVTLKIVIGVLGSSIAIISGLLAIYKYQENWIHYRTICEALRREKYLFLTKTTPYDKTDPNGLFVKTIETVLSKENNGWASNISKSAQSKKT
jgi:hypothetical protein